MDLPLRRRILCLISFSIFVLLIIIYSKGVSPGVFGGDSGDIVLSYFFAGVPHPPGYPLNTLLGVLFTRIIPGIGFAYKANSISVFYNAASIGLLFYLISRLTRNFLIGLSGALVLAFTPLVWLFAHFAEVFQLNLVLFSLSLVFLFEWIILEGHSKFNLRFFYLSIFFLGLAIFHHNTTILALPAFFYIIYKKRKYIRKKLNYFKLLGLFLAGAIPYPYILWAARRHTPVNWDDPTTFGNFIRLITRADYGSFSATQDLVGVDIRARFLQIEWYFLVIRADFGIFGLVLILLGLLYLFIKKREFFWFFAILAFFTGPFFLFYASFPLVDPFLFGTSERFLLLNYLSLAVFLAFGILASILIALKICKAIGLNFKISLLLFPCLFLLFPLVLASINYPKADLSWFTVGKSLGHDVLSSAEPGAIIFLQADTKVFVTQYSYYVERINRSAKILIAGRLANPSYRKQIMRDYPDLKISDEFKSDKFISSSIALDIIKKNFDKFPIYVDEPVPIPTDMSWSQEGADLRLYKKGEEPSGEFLQQLIFKKVSTFWFKPSIFDGRYSSFFSEHFRDIYARILTGNGNQLLYKNMPGEALPYFLESIAIYKNNEAFYGAGLAYMDLKDCNGAEASFKKITGSREVFALRALARVYGDCMGDKKRADEFTRRAASLEEKADTSLDKF